MGAQSEGRSPPFFARLLKEMQYTRCRKRLTTQAISLRNIALAFLSPDDAIVKKTLAGFTLLILVYSLLWLLRQTEAQPSARLRAELRDPSTGRALPGRFYLTDEQGNFKSPPGAVTYQKGAEQHFLADGSFELQLAPGRYSLAAERGPEFLPVSLALRLSSGEERKETLSMKRWIDMNRLGWYSGDLHNHRNVAEIRQLLLAEDLNLAPTLADWVWEDRERSTPPQAAQPVQPVDEIHVFSVLDKEVERLENGPGAVDLLGLKSPIPFQGYRLFPPNDTFCDAAHSQGGYVDAEKILWRDAAALVALGHIDFAGIVHNHFNRHGVELETDRWGMIPKYRAEFGTVAGMPLWSMEVYYRWLNCGFRLPVSAGSASGVKASPLGYNRVYVKVDGRFDYTRWFRSLKEGRSFATNGPMLFLTVNGKEPGAAVRLEEGRAPKVKVHAEALSPRLLDRLEVLFRGKVIKAVTGSQSEGKLVIDFESSFDETGWIAARCFEPAGRTIRFAHTSPVYIQVGSRVTKAREDARFFIEWIDREIGFYEREQGFREPRHREAMLALFRKARAVYAKLAQD